MKWKKKKKIDKGHPIYPVGIEYVLVIHVGIDPIYIENNWLWEEVLLVGSGKAEVAEVRFLGGGHKNQTSAITKIGLPPLTVSPESTTPPSQWLISSMYGILDLYQQCHVWEKIFYRTGYRTLISKIIKTWNETKQ